MMISVIVPIYNMEKYLPGFLECITTQSYRDLEILLIDDGSTDNSYKICCEWQEKDSRIKTYHKENEGLSYTKNYGLRRTTGDLIGFADPDDLLHPNMYKLLYEAMQDNNADMVLCMEQVFFDDDVPVPPSIDNYTVEEINDRNEYLNHFTDTHVGHTAWTWNKLYKREVLEGAEFPEGRYMENIPFNLKVAGNLKKCVWLKDRLYYYRQHANSIMHTLVVRTYTDHALSLMDQLKTVAELGDAQMLARHADYVCNLMLQQYVHVYKKAGKAEAEIILERYREVRKQYPQYSPSFKLGVKLFIKKNFTWLYAKILK